MHDLVTMQKHLTVARARVSELEVELIEVQDEGDNSRLKYRVALILSAGLIIWLGLSNMDYADENRLLNAQVQEFKQSELPQRFNNVLGMLHLQNDRVFTLEEANARLIRECKPCDLKRAIKSTPPPALVKGA